MGLQSATVQSVSIRQNFHVETENSLNELINFLFNGAYICDSICYYFERFDVALSGMADLNRLCRESMLQGTRKLMKYVVARGGKIVFDDINKPERQEWGTALNSLESLLQIKKTFYQSILKTHQIGDKYNDEHLKEYLETEFLEPTLNFIRKGEHFILKLYLI
jgi:ferritin heavy chain